MLAGLFCGIPLVQMFIILPAGLGHAFRLISPLRPVKLITEAGLLLTIGVSNAVTIILTGAEVFERPRLSVAFAVIV